MAPEVATPLTLAVLAGNEVEVEAHLRAGASPDATWGTLPLIGHAALLPSLAIFRSLMSHGAHVPGDLLHEIVTWELGDWRITSDEEEQQMADILRDLRHTNAWLPKEEREKLAEMLEGYKLRLLVECLRGDN
ncbi:hypothetical protein [Chthoniobacter flavus]|uniref:hypothetical protein n=1 Tax=Chthoniobacter flavus TaxID=191863 RepID=UPI00104F52DE|nr:hypothetical protein [Chthoniobacter flavus]